MNKQSKQHQHPPAEAAAAAGEAGEEAAETKVHNGVGCMTGSRKYLVIDWLWEESGIDVMLMEEKPNKKNKNSKQQDKNLALLLLMQVGEFED